MKGKKWMLLSVFLIFLASPIVHADNISQTDNLTDDWQYNATQQHQVQPTPSYSMGHAPQDTFSDTLGYIFYTLLALLLLTGFGFSIYYLITGYQTEGIWNPKTKIGISIITMLLIWIALSASSILLESEAILLISGIIILATAIIGSIIGIIYALKTNNTLALVPIILIPILLILTSLSIILVLNSAQTMVSSSYGETMSSSQPSQDIGYSVGGANDIENFRENIKEDYLPIPSDITSEGLYHDYYFDTGQTEPCNERFCPSYSYAKSNDPISGEEEQFLQVGLNSGIKDFERKKLNLVVVMDISGSMSSDLSQYYYDDPSKERNTSEKMEAAKQAIVDMTDQLRSDDRLGIVLYNNQGYRAKPLNPVNETDMEAIRKHVKNDVRSSGGTNFEAGYKEATTLLEEYQDVDQTEYENRILYLTDAMPNVGATDEEELLGMTESNAKKNIYTTFIGIGVDFNTELIDHITKIQGSNYYSVHSADEFQERLADEFEYMVTPLVFDLNIELDAEGYEIEKIYGSPEANRSTGELMKVNTLFPSTTEKGETEGGVVLLRLNKTGEDGSIRLSASYEDRQGREYENSKSVTIPDVKAPYHENTGLRKAILLGRYVDVMKNWIVDERKDTEPSVTEKEGIPPAPTTLNKWERQSVQLQVSQDYKNVFEDFKNHFENETNTLDDETLQQELDILETLTSS